VAGGIHWPLRELLCSTQYFYIVDSDTYLKNTEHALLRFHCNNSYANVSQPHVYVHCLSCFCLEVGNGVGEVRFPQKKIYHSQSVGAPNAESET
jgi:hypothetical protein